MMGGYVGKHRQAGGQRQPNGRWGRGGNLFSSDWIQRRMGWSGNGGWSAARMVVQVEGRGRLAQFNKEDEHVVTEEDEKQKRENHTPCAVAVHPSKGCPLTLASVCFVIVTQTCGALYFTQASLVYFGVVARQKSGPFFSPDVNLWRGHSYGFASSDMSQINPLF